MVELKNTIRARLGTHHKRSGTRPLTDPPVEGYVTVHVQNGQRIGSPLRKGEWLWQAQPLPWDRAKAEAYLSGSKPAVGLEVRPRVPQGRRLLHRAVQAFLQGRYGRSMQLVERAKSAAIREMDVPAIDAIRGFIIDTMVNDEEHRNAGTCRRWLAQADWWTGGGVWPGGEVAHSFWEAIAQEALRRWRAEESEDQA